MGWFDEQIRQRIQHDDDNFSDAFAAMAGVVMGERISRALNDDRVQAKNLYSIHRCAMMEYQHVNQYIAKMVRIFVICALNAGRETENLCRENDLRLCHMDHDVFDA